MIPMQERNALLTALLPVDPEPNQVVTMPEGQIAGAAHTLHLYKGETLVGTASTFSPVPNVSRKGSLTRAVTSIPLRLGDIIRVKFVQYNFTSVIFVEYFGWLGQDHIEYQVSHDRVYRVSHLLPLGPNTPESNLYERVCLEAQEKESK